MSIRRRTFLSAGSAVIAAPFAARAQGADDIVLGSTGILSGPLGGPVKVMLSGADAAFKSANEQGGVAGRRVRLVSLDDELKPEKAVANYQTLLNEHKASAFFGCVGSGTTAASAAFLKESNSAMVGGYAVADSARERTNGHGFFLRASAAREAEALVQHLTTIGITRIAMAYLDNPGGAETFGLVTKSLQALKLTPTSGVAIKGDGSNIAEAARSMQAGEPQAILMYLGGPIPGRLMKAFWDMGVNPSFYGMSIVDGGVTAKVVGDKARGLAIAQVMPYPWGTADGFIRTYREAMNKAGLPVGYYTFEGWFSAQVMLEALQRTGRDLTRSRLLATLRGLRLRQAMVDIDFSTGQTTGSRFVELVQVSHDGRFVR